MENNYTVYMHISPSDKRYIGITSIKVEKRWQNGKGYKNNKYFTNAIEKYGWNNFEHIIIETDLSEEQAKEMEIELIAKWDSTNPNKGYNITLGGEGGNGKHHSEETKRKISGKNSGENNYWYGKHLSEETKRKIGEASKSRTHTEETKRKIGEANSGENHPRVKSVVVIIDDKVFAIFNYMAQGIEYFGCNKGHVSECCRGKRNYCGKYNGEKLVWKYITIIEL